MKVEARIQIGEERWVSEGMDVPVERLDRDTAERALASVAKRLLFYAFPDERALPPPHLREEGDEDAP